MAECVTPLDVVGVLPETEVGRLETCFVDIPCAVEPCFDGIYLVVYKIGISSVVRTFEVSF
jgi:hypothetical protein